MQVLFTVKDICARYTLTKQTIRRLIKEGKFPAPLRVGRSLRWTADAIAEFEGSNFS